MRLKNLKIKTKSMPYYPEGTHLKKTRYVQVGYILSGEVDIDNVAFHFTPSKNFASIQVTGLRPNIGANSSGSFGKEALEKTFFSYGKNGVMQLFNRLVSATCEMSMDGYRKNNEKKQYLLDYQKKEEIIPNDINLTMLEAFEYVRRYMEECSYFAFAAVQPQYSKQINENVIDSQIKSINENLNSITGVTLTDLLSDTEKCYLIFKSNSESHVLESKKIEDKENAEYYDRKIGILKDAKSILFKINIGESKEIERPYDVIKCIDALATILDRSEDELIGRKLAIMRAQISIGIREKSKEQIDLIRGKALPESLENANFERIDFNEDMVAWIDIYKHPHNAHTMIVDGEEGQKGVIIDGSKLSMISLDGMKPATGVELTKHIFDNSTQDDRIHFVMDMNGHKDVLVVEDFYKYVELYNQYKSNPIEFKKQLKVFEGALNNKYRGFHIYNTNEMTDDRMTNFIEQCTIGKKMDDLETR